jgi:hypothetical protein
MIIGRGRLRLFVRRHFGQCGAIIRNCAARDRATGHTVADLLRHVFVDRAGVRFLFCDTEFGQHIENFV